MTLSRPQELARRLGVFDATMIVMGGIVGAGIFRNPSEVARHVSVPSLMLLAWTAGGIVALAGAFVYAELAQRRPEVGGQYAYLRDAFHPMAAFLYGWTLLLVTQTGGMAAVAMTFADYFRELTGLHIERSVIAVVTLGALTIVNCFGVRSGSNVQNTFMVMKIAAIVMLVLAGWNALKPGTSGHDAMPATAGTDATHFLAAMVPVLFAYGGWQTASFVSGEMREPEQDLPRGLLLGVLGVVMLYLAVNVVCIVALGPGALASTSTPASDVMRRALGAVGAKAIAAGIAISTVGFLSQGMLTAPRVYFAMARDGVFFEKVGTISDRTRAPVVAIVVQGIWASVIAVVGLYAQVLNYVVALDAVFFGLTGAALLVFRRRDPVAVRGMRMPGHPWTTSIFVIAFWTLALSTIIQFPRDAGMGVLILLLGVPVYLYWKRDRRVATTDRRA
ncbi:MAG TPA: amino acid permease [Gemmatimonadaceae bacterium]|nr:amino acid permease [Gemmatimonadaceae bacterium]